MPSMPSDSPALGARNANSVSAFNTRRQQFSILATDPARYSSGTGMILTTQIFMACVSLRGQHDLNGTALAVTRDGECLDRGIQRHTMADQAASDLRIAH